MKTKYLVYILAVLIILLIVAVGYRNSMSGNVVNEKPTIKIGVLAPMSGSMAFLGDGTDKAIKLAQEQLGGSKYNYEVIIEDSKLDARETAIATQKLIDIDNVDALISLTSGPGNVVSPMAQQNGKIHIALGSDPNLAKGKFNFIHWTPPREEARVFVKELQRRNITKVAILIFNQQGAIAIIDDFKKEIVGTNIVITDEELFNVGDKDFKTIIQKAKKTKPQVYFIQAFSPELELLTKQIKEAGIKEPLTAIETFEFSDQPGLFEGYWYVQAADMTGTYQDAYSNKFNEPAAYASGNVYDAFNLIATAYERAGESTQGKKPTTEQARNELSKIENFDGAMGKLTVQPDRIVLSEAVVREIRDGKPVTISSPGDF